MTIVGVGPRGFNGDAGAVSADFWLSISAVGIGGPFAVANLDRRQDHWFTVKARLAPGVTVERARGELQNLAVRHGELFPDIDRGRDITLFALGEVRMHPLVDELLTGGGIGLFVVAGVVLLLACGNLANLLLVRGIARAPELAIREALGGDRGQIGRPLLIEALLLSLLGGALGLVAAIWLQGILSAIPLPPANRALDVRFDYRMVVFSVLAALGTGCLFGLLPSWRSAATNVASALRDAGRTSSTGSSSLLRSTLVAAQVALSVVLVAATALLARSFVNAERVDPGVDAERIAVIGTNLLARRRHRGGKRRRGGADSRAHQGAARRRGAALTIRLPLSPGRIVVDDCRRLPTADGNERHRDAVLRVSFDYFATMGIPLLAGRGFAATDRPSSPPVAIVSETAARLFFGGDAVGRRLRRQDDADSWIEVVGVVADVKVAELQEPPTPLVYYSTEQTNPGGFSVVVRAAGDPAALLDVLPRAISDVRASLPVTRIDAFETQVAGALEAARTSALFMGAFAALALVLAGLGIYAAVVVLRRAADSGDRHSRRPRRNGGAAGPHGRRLIFEGRVHRCLRRARVGRARCARNAERAVRRCAARRRELLGRRAFADRGRRARRVRASAAGRAREPVGCVAQSVTTPDTVIGEIEKTCIKGVTT